MRTWSTAVAVAMAAVALVVAGCGSSKSSNTATSSSSASSTTSSASSGADMTAAEAFLAQYEKAPTAILQTIPLPRKPPAHGFLYNVADNNAQDIEIGNDAGVAVKALGWRYKQTVINPDDPAQVQQVLMNALAEHATAVIDPALPVSVLGKSVITAYENAKVPLVISGVTPFTPTRWLRGPVQGHENGVIVGKILAAWFVVNSDGRGKALIEDVPAFTGLEVLRNSFISQTKAWCPKCVVQEANFSVSQVDAGAVTSGVVSALRANPSLTYLISDQGQFIPGIDSALAAAGLSDIKIAGNAFAPQNAAALKTGKELAWTGLDDNYYGLCNVDAALRGVEGAPNNDECDPLLTQLFTKSTIGSVNVDNYQAMPGENQQFYKLWHIA